MNSNSIPGWLLSLVLLLLAGCEGRTQYALGTLEWDRVNGRAIASEAITELYVREGDAVEADQPLLQLDDALQRSQVLQSRSRIDQLTWHLKELETGYRTERIAAAEAEYEATVATRENRELEYRRLSKLIADNLTSQRNLDLARTAMNTAIGAEQAALEELNRLRAGFRTEQIAQARAELAAEQAALQYQEELLGRYKVLAERKGVLESFPFKLGDKPPANAVVTTVLSGAKPWARVYLPQPWLSRIEQGTLVDVYVDGRDAPMQGRVRHIESRPSFTPYYALAEEDRQRLTYVTEVDLLDEAAVKLPVGIPVRVGLRGQQ